MMLDDTTSLLVLHAETRMEVTMTSATLAYLKNCFDFIVCSFEVSKINQRKAEERMINTKKRPA